MDGLHTLVIEQGCKLRQLEERLAQVERLVSQLDVAAHAQEGPSREPLAVPQGEDGVSAENEENSEPSILISPLRPLRRTLLSPLGDASRQVSASRQAQRRGQSRRAAQRSLVFGAAKPASPSQESGMPSTSIVTRTTRRQAATPELQSLVRKASALAERPDLLDPTGDADIDGAAPHEEEAIPSRQQRGRKRDCMHDEDGSSLVEPTEPLHAANAGLTCIPGDGELVTTVH